MRAFAVAAAGCALVAASWAPAAAGPATQIPRLGDVVKRAQQLRDIQITDDEEQEIGAAVSERVRNRYGVVQDQAVHKYVSLVGTVLALASSRPNIIYRFIVLDTDGVNAFAAPGGYIMITRGALGLIANEAELADVLAHELTHVTSKHTIRAIQKGKVVQLAADETVKDQRVFQKLVDVSTDLVLAGFGRDEEFEADREGLRLANRVGYDPHGLSTFLSRLTERNKSATTKQGLFASHPEMQERLRRIARQITDERLASTAVLEARFRKAIPYRATAQADIAVIEGGAAGLAGSGGGEKPKEGEQSAKPEEQKKKGGFGLATLLKPSGSESKSAEVIGSGASRGLDWEFNAKGGPVKTMVAVRLTAEEIATFKKEGDLK
jgi:predicted Zn-dependent protease